MGAPSLGGMGMLRWRVSFPPRMGMASLGVAPVTACVAPVMLPAEPCARGDQWWGRGVGWQPAMGTGCGDQQRGPGVGAGDLPWGLGVGTSREDQPQAHGTLKSHGGLVWGPSVGSSRGEQALGTIHGTRHGDMPWPWGCGAGAARLGGRSAVPLLPPPPAAPGDAGPGTTGASRWRSWGAQGRGAQ